MEWGIGHATRCVPIIDYLLEKGQKVIIGGEGRSLQFLKRAYPGLEFIIMPGFKVKYHHKGHVAMHLLRSAPALFWSFYREHKQLKHIIHKQQIDAVISDNRYGLFSRSVTSIFMTHQVMIAAPAGFKFVEPFLSRITRFFMKRYDECWIPDFKGGENLSGDLAHRFKLPVNTRFIGPLSRFFQIQETQDSASGNPDLLAIISGPEPQRTVFEHSILSQLKDSQINAIVVLGKTEELKSGNKQENLRVYDHVSSKQMLRLMQSAGVIVARSGYSTLMDLYAIGRKAAFVPTPGQTEQEYLAHYHAHKNDFPVFFQNDPDIQAILVRSQDYEWPHEPYSLEMLHKAIDRLLNSL